MADGLSVLVTDPRPAISAIRDYVTGANVDVLEIAHAGLDLASFGLSQFHKHPPTMGASLSASSKETAERLLAAINVKGSDEIGDLAAVDWAQVFALAMQLVMLLFAKK